MYYNKGRTSKQLEEGIDDAAGIVEELFSTMNSLAEAFKYGNLCEIEQIATQWDGWIPNIK